LKKAAASLEEKSKQSGSWEDAKRWHNFSSLMIPEGGYFTYEAVREASVVMLKSHGILQAMLMEDQKPHELSQKLLIACAALE